MRRLAGPAVFPDRNTAGSTARSTGDSLKGTTRSRVGPSRRSKGTAMRLPSSLRPVFTGIIESLGTVTGVELRADGGFALLTVEAGLLVADLPRRGGLRQHPIVGESPRRPEERHAE